MAPSRPEGALKELQILSLTVSYRELSMMQIARSVVNQKFTYFLPSRAAAEVYFGEIRLLLEMSQGLGHPIRIIYNCLTTPLHMSFVLVLWDF